MSPESRNQEGKEAKNGFFSKKTAGMASCCRNLTIFLTKLETNFVMSETDLIKSEADFVMSETNFVRSEPDFVMSEANFVKFETNFVMSVSNPVIP